jgi:hypothetical protein
MTMKKSLMNAHPELRLESIIDSLGILIRDNGFTHLIPQYDALLNEYNEIMED